MKAERRILSDTASGCLTAFGGVMVAMLVCLMLSLCCTGCKAGKTVTEYIEKPVIVTQEHHTESVRLDIVRDTIHQKDSIFYYINGDTVRIERWHYLQGSTNVVRVDTLVKVDSVQVPVITEKIVTQTKEVEKPLRWWQRALMVLGGVVLIGGCLYTAWRVGKRKLTNMI